MKSILKIIPVLFLLVIIVPVSAQKICWQKFDLDSCKTTVFSEFGISKRLNPMLDYNSSDEIQSTSVNFDLNLGIKTKVGPKIYMGALLFLDLNQVYINPKFGARGRISYHPSQDVTLNLSPGMILVSGNSSVYKNTGFSLEGSVDYKNMVGIFSRFDILNRKDEQNEMAINLGIRTGGLTGATSGAGCLTGGACLAGCAAGVAAITFVYIITAIIQEL